MSMLPPETVRTSAEPDSVTLRLDTMLILPPALTISAEATMSLVVVKVSTTAFVVTAERIVPPVSMLCAVTTSPYGVADEAPLKTTRLATFR